MRGPGRVPVGVAPRRCSKGRFGAPAAPGRELPAFPCPGWGGRIGWPGRGPPERFSLPCVVPGSGPRFPVGIGGRAATPVLAAGAPGRSGAPGRNGAPGFAAAGIAPVVDGRAVGWVPDDVGRAAGAVAAGATGAAGRAGAAVVAVGAIGLAAAGGTIVGTPVAAGALCGAATVRGAAGAAAGFSAAGTTAGAAAGLTTAGVAEAGAAAAGFMRAAFAAASFASFSAFAEACALASASATPCKCLRTFSATSTGTELECVFFSVTPYCGSRSITVLALTSSSRASSLILT
jgi:hypothetical protein